jgi:ribosomal protein L16 Arg81 hydroxylase
MQKVPDDERKLLEGLNTAPDINANLQVGNEFLKKFSKSPRRPRVAAYLAQEVSKVPDNEQRIKLSESFAASFKEPDEVDLVKPTIIDALVKQNKFDEAFAEAAKYLPRHPDDVVLQTQLGIIGIEQAQRQNPKFVQPAQQYAGKVHRAHGRRQEADDVR